MLELKSRKCPACESDDRSIIGRPRKIDAIFSSIKDADISECRIVQCKACSLYYVNPFPFFSSELLAKMYSNDNTYFQELSDQMEHIIHFDNPERRFNSLVRFSKRPIQNFLEIGCGQGFGLQAGQKRGWTVHGQDVSADFAGLVKDRLGIDIMVGPLKKDSYREGQFDAVYIDSVLEHVPDPVAYLSFVCRFLAPGGVAYVTLPNEGSIPNYLMDLFLSIKGSKATSRMMPFTEPYHILGFTKKSIRRLCELVGLNVLQVKCNHGYAHIERNKLPFSLSGSAKRMLFGVLGQLFDAMDSGMNMEVVLVKPDQP